MMRSSTPRWLSAAVTCLALKPGFSGTRMAPSLKTAYVIEANSALLPKLTATRSPFLTPRERRDCAIAFEARSSFS